MKKESFLNWDLMLRLTILFAAGLNLAVGIVYAYGENADPVASIIYIGLAFIIVLCDAIYRLSVKIGLTMEGLVAIMQAFAVLGQQQDHVARQVTDTNRFIMHKLLTEEEKAKLIELTNDEDGSDDAEALAHWLFDGPVEVMEKRNEMTRQEEESAN